MDEEEHLERVTALMSSARTGFVLKVFTELWEKAQERGAEDVVPVWLRHEAWPHLFPGHCPSCHGIGSLQDCDHSSCPECPGEE